MKIIHADTDDLGNPLAGGAPVRTFEVNRRLAERHNITVLTAGYRKCIRSERRNKITYTRLGCSVPFWGLSSHLSYLALLRSRVRAIPHDLVVEEFMPPVGFCGLPWATPKPVISLVQWFFFDYWETRYHLPFQHWMRCIARKKRYRYFIVQTKNMRDRFQSLVPEAQVRIISCGIAPESLRSRQDISYENFVLFLGRLDIWQKGLDTLVEAWQGLCGYENIRLIIAGEGNDRSKLEQDIQRRGLQHLISLQGKVEGGEKQHLLDSCRFVVMPSREETFGLVALEAMAAQKAVIAFDIENLGELLHPEWSILLPGHSPKLLGKAIIRLWHDQQQCMGLGIRGRQQAEGYSWDTIAAQQEQFYREVIQQDRQL